MAQRDERSRRTGSGEGGHRTRSPHRNQARRPQGNGTNRTQGTAAARSQSPAASKTAGRTGASAAAGGGSGKSQGYNAYRSGKNGKKKGGNPALYIGVGAIALIALIAIVLMLKFSSGTEETAAAESETETTVPQDVILQPAAIDLSALGVQIAESGESQTAEESQGESEAQTQASGSLLQIQGMTPEEIRSRIQELYSWSMVIYNESADVGATVTPTVDANATTEAATLGDAENPDSLPKEEAETSTQPAEITVSAEYQVPDMVLGRVDQLLSEIEADDEAYRSSASQEATAETESSEETASQGESGESAQEETTQEAKVYVLSLDGLEDAAAQAADYAATMWYKSPKGGSIGSYDSTNDKFIMEGAENGFAVDQEALKSSILSAVSAKEFDARIEAPGQVLSAEEATAASEYKTIATFTTKTTANSVRNKNIRLACQAINGTILRPGEEFSFNNVVGERTESKGYGAATAYNEGEVVQEVGGGICQVSSTLYNAVVKAGLKTTKRQSHTFEPNYVTPGMDATVSWGGPDYRFANVPAHAEYSNSDSYAVGIRASYSNQQVTISIYGRPVLKSGITYELSSKKVKDIDVVRKKIEPGSDKTPTRGTKGSQWATNLVVKQNGEVISNELDHNTYYSGHIEYYTDETTAAETTTAVPESSTEASTAESMTEATNPELGDTPPELSGEPQTGPEGGPGVIISGTSSGQEAGPGASQGASYGPGGSSGPDSSGPGVPQTTAAPAPTAPQTTAAPAPAAPETTEALAPVEAPQAPAAAGPISDAPPAL